MQRTEIVVAETLVTFRAVLRYYISSRGIEAQVTECVRHKQLPTLFARTLHPTVRGVEVPTE